MVLNMHIQTRSKRWLGTCGAPTFFQPHRRIVLIYFTQFSPLLCINWEITPGCSQLQPLKLLMLHFDYTNAVPPIYQLCSWHVKSSTQNYFITCILMTSGLIIWNLLQHRSITNTLIYTEIVLKSLCNGTNADTVKPPKMRKPWVASHFTLMDKVVLVIPIFNKKNGTLCSWMWLINLMPDQLTSIVNTKQEQQMQNWEYPHFNTYTRIKQSLLQQ